MLGIFLQSKPNLFKNSKLNLNYFDIYIYMKLRMIVKMRDNDLIYISLFGPID